jgi:hypothetical protein
VSTGSLLRAVRSLLRSPVLLLGIAAIVLGMHALTAGHGTAGAGQAAASLSAAAAHTHPTSVPPGAGEAPAPARAAAGKYLVAAPETGYPGTCGCCGTAMGIQCVPAPAVTGLAPLAGLKTFRALPGLGLPAPPGVSAVTSAPELPPSLAQLSILRT